ISRPEWDRSPATPAGNPRVAIIVPARNEEHSIEQALHRLTALDYPNYQIIAVNDRSTDRTGEIMDEVEKCSGGPPGPPSPSPPQSGPPQRLKIVHVRELPPGWMGKAHAMWTAARQADCDWRLFTD